MRFAILLAVFGLMAAGAQAQTAAPAPDAAAPAPAAPAPAAAPAAQAPAKPTHTQHAATHTRMTMAQRFAAANTSHDGHLTEAQAKAGLPVVYRHFQDIDTEHKGYVTTADLRAYDHAQYVKRMQAKKAKAAATPPSTPATVSQ